MKLLSIGFPYLFLLSLSFFSGLWIFFGLEENFRILACTFLVIHIVYNHYYEKISVSFFNSKLIQIFITLLFGLGFILFPVRDLRLGDGILLLENFLLEVTAFGYTVVPDEILTGLLHSSAFVLVNNFSSDPMDTYRVLSTLTGIVFLITLNYLIIKFSLDWLVLVLFMSCGGTLVYYGYMENYTQVSFFMFLILFLGYSYIDKKENQFFYLFTLAILSAISALFHLITGFLIFALLFFCMYISKEGEDFQIKEILKSKKFYKNGILAGIPAITLLGFFYIYFLGFSDLRIDPSLAHASHPPFLNVRQIFTIQHLKDLILEGVFIAFPIIYVLKILVFKEWSKLRTELKTPGGIFLVLGFLGIVIHFLSYNPLLGYPADWDLMGFFFIPTFVFSIHLYKTFREEFRRYLPLFIFGYGWVLILAFHLGGTENQKIERDYLKDTNSEYFSKIENQMNTIEAKYRKNYLHTDFFLFRTEKKLRLAGEKELHTRNLELQAEFRTAGIFSNKEKWKDFLRNATEFHHDYLKWVENNK